MDKKVALYARVSTERQEQAGTIESQVAELENYAQSQGYQIDAALIFLDQAVSGAYLARPALDQLRDAAYEGGIDLLLCLSPDRLARQYVHQRLLLDEFQRWGVAVQFINQPNLEDSPHNRLLLGVQGLFAEYERAVIRERMRRGRLHRMRQGGRCFHPAPFGYRYIPVSEPNGGSWEIDSQETAVVRQIFAWYTEERWSLKKIARTLNETGVPVRWNAGRIGVIRINLLILEKRTIIDIVLVLKVWGGAGNKVGDGWWHPITCCAPEKNGLLWTHLQSFHKKSGRELRNNACSTNVFLNVTITSSSTCCAA